MNSTDKSHKKSLLRIRTATVLLSLIALAALLLSVYALMQKKEADEQAKLAKKNITEALLQQKIALEQRNIADSNKEQALQQRELALESEKQALLQRKIADAETRKAEENRLEALKQQYLAEEQKLYAAQQTKIAETNAGEAKKQQGEAILQRSIANDQKQISGRLKELADSRKMAKEAVLMINERYFDSSKDKALQAYMINNVNDGPEQNSDIYDALNMNWIKSINNKNQFNFHGLPVHAVCGIPGSDIIFTADESGMLYESVIKNNGAQEIAFYAIKEEVRALAVSGAGNRLVALTTLGNGLLFKVSSAGISFLTGFKFTGAGKAVAFDAADNMILLSSKGMTKYSLNDLGNPVSVSNENISNFTISKSGTLYIASGNTVKIYNNWDALMSNSVAAVQKFDAKVLGIAVDNNEQYMAAGTYSGFVCITSVRNNAVLWSRALHLSSVNDLEFATVNGGKLQLSSAGADQTIKLIDVTAIIKRSSTEDILTLKGHSKWIYSLYYTQAGHWLCSAGEDNKVIAWKPTMNDLYKTLTENK
jgi:WD40 repeat protein